MPDKVAYDIVKTFIEKRDELVAVHGEAKSIDAGEPGRRRTRRSRGIRARLKYFDEKGVKM